MCLRILTQQATQDDSRLRELLAANQIEVLAAQFEAVTMEDVFVHSIYAEENMP